MRIIRAVHFLCKRFFNDTTKLLFAGKHPKGSPKRTKEQDEAFVATLTDILASVWFSESKIWYCNRHSLFPGVSGGCFLFSASCFVNFLLIFKIKVVNEPFSMPTKWGNALNLQWRQKNSVNTPHVRPLFLLIVEVPLWKPLIRDLFVNSQKHGCLLPFFVGYQVRGLFQKWRFGFKNYNSITISPSMLWNRRSRCLPSVGHLFQDHSRTIVTFCLQNCFQCYEMAFFIGYQVEGCFSSIKVQKSSIRSLTSE